MRVLVFGVGAIGSLMVHYLCKAGNDVAVVARSTYEELKKKDSSLAALFKKKNSEAYYTESGYRSYISQASYSQLKRDNASNNYNKAWGTFID